MAAAGAGATIACGRLADAAAILLGRTALVAAAGNPSPGTASTLGHRIPGTPRLALVSRFTFVPVEMPQLITTGNATASFTATAWSVEGIVGLTQGLALLPTVGGFGAIDVFGGAGVVHLPIHEGFRGRKPGTWTIGARLGILRESFTAPGLTLSGQYRRLSQWNLGDVRLVTGESFLRAESTSIWSLRAVLGKRVAPVAFTIGAGADRMAADVVMRVRSDGEPVESRHDDWNDTRTNLFANAAWTFVILTFSAEAGWQSALDDERSGSPGGGGLWGSLAARLTF